MTARDVVYVVAKAPMVGGSKTRLCPPLEPREAAALAEAFVLDSIATVRRAACEARVICRNRDEQVALRALVRGAARIDVQLGSGLGAALRSAFRMGLRDGFTSVAVLGADSPTLPAAVIQQAFIALSSGANVALGPSEDGGYYLLAASALYPSLFRGMPWSTDAVAAVTLARCRAAGLRTHLLPTWYDVDDVSALARLEADLAGSEHVAPHTCAVVLGWESRHHALRCDSPPAQEAVA